jgi:plastocyanin
LFLLLTMAVFIPFMDETQALESTFAQTKKFDVPVREISLIATPEGYYPEAFSVFAGEKVRFYLTNTGNTPSCLMLPDKELFLSAQKGNVSEGTAFFPKTGVYKFYCPTGKIKGRITVIPRPKTEEELEAERKLASERMKNRVRVWYPKEE